METRPIVNVPHKWPGIWPGTVVDNHDPERRGRLRIRADQVYGCCDAVERIDDHQLPWAEACLPASGTGFGVGVIPSIGSPVWITFWGGDPESPVWVGSWLGAADGPTELESSYAGGSPQSYVLKTPGGQAVELRWLEADQKVELKCANGNHVSMYDAGNAQGSRIEIGTAGGAVVLLDDVSSTVEVRGPSRVVLSAGADFERAVVGEVTESTTGNVIETVQGNVVRTVQGSLTEMVVGAFQQTFGAAFAVACLLAATLTAGGLLSLLGAGVVIATSGAAVAIGSVAGSKQALVMANFITDVYNGHTHGYTSPTGPAVTAVPTPLGDVGTHATQNVEAD